MPATFRGRAFALGLLLAVASAILPGCDRSGLPSAGTPPPANLLLISVDTLRADRLGSFGYARNTTPNLDALARESLVFTRAQAASSWTLPSFASLMTSLYSSTHRCFGFASVLGDAHTTLAEILADAGFATGAVVSHVFLAPQHGLDQGFADYDEALVRENPAESHRAVTSRQVTERGLRWLAQPGRDDARWFLWLHYFDPHALYRAHEDLDLAFALATDADRYDGEVAFTDRAIGALLDGLASAGRLDRTLVVVVSDHGVEFGEHGGEGHGGTLFAEVLRVPLLIRVPGGGHQRLDALVRTVDLMPTLLDLLGVDAAGRGADWEGASLLPLVRGAEATERAALAELRVSRTRRIDSIERGRWKLVLDQSQGGIALFDVESDPGETRDRAAENPRVVAALERELSDRIAAAEEKARRFGGEQRVELSDQQRERLRRLGYVE